MPECSACGKTFEHKFSFQSAMIGGVTRHFCSQRCRMGAEAGARGQVACSVCSASFEPRFAYQQAVVDGEARHFCSTGCRAAGIEEQARKLATVRRIAVLNQKGGTGKTTTTVNLAAALADRGFRTLLVDVDVQGNVGISLGLEKASRGLADLMSDATIAPEDCIVPARENLDLLAGGARLGTVETALARRDERPEGLLRERLGRLPGYAFQIIDCGPSRSMLNRNALLYADEVIVPVACDYLSLVGVRQILETLREINATLAHPVSVLGVIPTFYDRRTRISRDVIHLLRRYFQDRVMPPVRVNARLREAPANGRTIFEYDRRSRGAADYRALARCVVDRRWDSSFLDRLSTGGAFRATQF